VVVIAVVELIFIHHRLMVAKNTRNANSKKEKNTQLSRTKKSHTLVGFYYITEYL